ncbi:MAG: hypothetical protein KBC56_08700 [Flavobacterium sp.]|nr:hypothetical protein [Flavobacterium sp.]
MEEENKPAEEVNTETVEQQPEFVVRVASDDNKPIEEVAVVEKVETAKVETDKPAETEIEKTIDPPATEEVKTKTKSELDETAVLDYLKAKGITAENFDDLKPKEQRKLSAEAEKFAEFNEKTGRGMSDFLETQKDWKVVAESNPEKVIKKQLALDNPTLDKEDIEFLYNERFTYDEDFAEEKEMKSKNIAKKVELQRALDNLEKQKTEYEVPLGESDLIPTEYKTAKSALEQITKGQEEYDILVAETRKDFVSKTEDIFNDKFEGFKVKVGEEEMVVKPENLKEAKQMHLDSTNFHKKFFDEAGKIKDPVGYHKAMNFAMNPDKMATHFFNLGKAHQAETEEKESKNIQMDRLQSVAKAQADGFFIKKAD